MHYWLFKTEPGTFSIDDLAASGLTDWEGVRNYQARNRLRDDVKVGDQVLIYHSSCKTPAITGLAEVSRAGHPDPGQFDPTSDYHDPRATPDNPRWIQVSLNFLAKFPVPLTLAQIREEPVLRNMELVNRSRLSIQHVSREDFLYIMARMQRAEGSQ